jgi:hypothetical protein
VRFLPTLLALAALPASAEEHLGWKFETGETLVYSVQNTWKFWPWLGSDGQPIVRGDENAGSGKYVETMTLHARVVEVNGDGAATLEITFPKVRVQARLDSTGEEGTWDSASGKSPADFGFGPFEALHKSVFSVIVQINGEWTVRKAPLDYLLPGKTKVRKTEGKMTRSEIASDSMPMPLPFTFWLDQVFSGIPPDGRARKFTRAFTELLERREKYDGSWDSDRRLDGRRCLLFHFEVKDRRIKEAKEDRSEMPSFSAGFADGEGIKTTLAAARRNIDAFFSPSDGIMWRVEGKARDDAFKQGSIARSQDWEIQLEKRIPAK